MTTVAELQSGKGHKDENFPVASRLLPAAMRPHVAALYAFARTADDFADEGEDFPGWEWLISIVRHRSASMFDYLKDAVLVIDEPIAVENFLTDAFQTLAQRYAETDAADDLGLRQDELGGPTAQKAHLALCEAHFVCASAVVFLSLAP